MGKPQATIGRYALYGEIAAGGMAAVHYGRLLGPVGFARTVAIKRLHAHLARDPEFVAMFLDEARLAARVRHTNVVQTLDVVASKGEIFLVMDYVQGEALSRLCRTSSGSPPVPPRIAAGIIAGILEGLHAAHTARDDHGQPLNIVHRDVSPHNIMVGIDGIARILDFGIAKAANRLQETDAGKIKGKFAYMAPEQLMGTVSPQTDVYAAGICLWEALVGRRLFEGATHHEMVHSALNQVVPRPGSLVEGIPEALDDVIMQSLQRDETLRPASARDLARAIESAITIASLREVSDWVQARAGEDLEKRALSVAAIESDSSADRSGDSAAALRDLRSEPPDGASRELPTVSQALPPQSGATSMSSVSERSETLDDVVVPRRRLRSTWLALLLMCLGVPALYFFTRERPVTIAPAASSSVSPESLVSAVATASSASVPVSAMALPSPSASAPRPPPVKKPWLKPKGPDCAVDHVWVDGKKRFKPECL